MAESTHTLKFSDFAKALSQFLDWGYSVPTDTTKLSQVTDLIRDAQRNLYWNCGHEWSFLKKSFSLTLSQTGTTTASTLGTSLRDTTTAKFNDSMVGAVVTFTVSGNVYTISSVTSSSIVVLGSSLSAGVDDGTGKAFTVTQYGTHWLPDDFGGMQCRALTFYDDTYADPVHLGSDDQVRDYQQGTQSPSRPLVACVRARTNSTPGTLSQRWELALWPVPDLAYTLQGRYSVQSDVMAYSVGVSDDYPLGGPMLSQALKEGCLAEAEATFNDGAGIHAAKYAALLQNAIRQDLLMRTPVLLGNLNNEPVEQTERFSRRSTMRADYET